MAISNFNPNFNPNPATIMDNVSDQLRDLGRQSQMLLQQLVSQPMTAENADAFLGNIEDLLSVTLGQNADISRGNLADKKAELDQNNERRKLLRDLRAAVRDGDKTKAKEIINDNAFMKNSESLKDFKSGSIDLEKLSDAIDDEMETRDDINSALAFSLQVLATAVSQAETIRSTIRKKFDDAAQQIIGNI